MDTSAKCYNCGAENGLHSFMTSQCPKNGVRAPANKREWEDTIFEDAKQRKLQDAAPALLGVLKKLQSWHEKYPLGRIYAMHQGQKMESELTKIVNMGIVAIKKAE